VLVVWAYVGACPGSWPFIDCAADRTGTPRARCLLAKKLRVRLQPFPTASTAQSDVSASLLFQLINWSPALELPVGSVLELLSCPLLG
jgi:hypothetical protein